MYKMAAGSGLGMRLSQIMHTSHDIVQVAMVTEEFTPLCYDLPYVNKNCHNLQASLRWVNYNHRQCQVLDSALVVLWDLSQQLMWNRAWINSWQWWAMTQCFTRRYYFYKWQEATCGSVVSMLGLGHGNRGSSGQYLWNILTGIFSRSKCNFMSANGQNATLLCGLWKTCSQWQLALTMSFCRLSYQSSDCVIFRSYYQL